MRPSVRLLNEAKKLLDSKGQDYGFLGKNFKQAAAIASIMRGKEISALDVCACFVGVKISRTGNLANKEASHEKVEDTLVDLANYSVLFGELLEVLGKEEE